MGMQALKAERGEDWRAAGVADHRASPYNNSISTLDTPAVVMAAKARRRFLCSLAPHAYV